MILSLWRTISILPRMSMRRMNQVIFNQHLCLCISSMRNEDNGSTKCAVNGQLSQTTGITLIGGELISNVAVQPRFLELVTKAMGQPRPQHLESGVWMAVLKNRGR